MLPPGGLAVVLLYVLEQTVVDLVNLLFDAVQRDGVLTVLLVVLAVQSPSRLRSNMTDDAGLRDDLFEV